MSLIHHWPLVDGLKDNLGRTPLTGSSTVAIGKIGPCREVDGQFLQASDSKLKGLDIFSISMWVKYSSAKAAWTDIFGLQITNGVTSTPLRLEITSVEGNKAGVFNNGILTTSSGAGTYITLEKEKWHHIVLTKDSSTIQYFLDGTLISQYNFLNIEGCTNGWGTGEFHIGDNKQNYKGCFNDVRIYDHVLSQTQVKLYLYITHLMTHLQNLRLIYCQKISVHSQIRQRQLVPRTVQLVGQLILFLLILLVNQLVKQQILD